MAVANIFHGKTGSIILGSASGTGLTRDIFNYALSEDVEFVEGTLHNDPPTSTRTWLPAFKTWFLGFMLFVHDNAQMSSFNIHTLMLNPDGFDCEIHLDGTQGQGHFWAGAAYLQSWSIEGNANGVPMMTCAVLGNGDINTEGWA